MPWAKDSKGNLFKTGGALPTPVLSGLVPASIASGAPTPMTVSGSGFAPASKVWADEEAQITSYVNPTTLRYTAEADQAGTQTITVRTGSKTSAAIELTVT